MTRFLLRVTVVLLLVFSLATEASAFFKHHHKKHGKDDDDHVRRDDDDDKHTTKHARDEKTKHHQTKTGGEPKHHHDDSFPKKVKHMKSHDFLVKGLEDIEPAFGKFKGDMYAGTIPIDDTNKERGTLMFWLFAPEKPKVKDTMTVWFNGGPGCSSFSAGLLFEHSPVTVPSRAAGHCCESHKEPLQYNPHAWTEATYMLYVEQPAGTGFSRGIEPRDEDDVARDFTDWILNFYQVFPDLKTYDLFITGESYAGMYVPSVARGLYLENRKGIHDFDIPIKGAAIGNGWIDVVTQGPAVIDFAYWHGMIDMASRDYFQAEWKRCYRSFQRGDHAEQPDPFHAFTTSDECGIQEAVLSAAGDGLFETLSPNTFDVTTWDMYPTLSGDPGTTNHDFFNDPRVQKALHAPHMDWHACLPPEDDDDATPNDDDAKDDDAKNDDKAGHHHGHGHARHLKMLDKDRPYSMLPYIAELVDDAGIRVLVYNADLDLSVCAQGSEQALNRMEWSGQGQWMNANRSLWVVDGGDVEIAGYTKYVGNLEFLIVRNSGHLVPHNVPRNALDLITRFVRGDHYADRTLPNFVVNNKLPKATFDEEKEQQWRDGFSWRSAAVNLGVAVVAFLIGLFVAMKVRRNGYEPIGGHGWKRVNLAPESASGA